MSWRTRTARSINAKTVMRYEMLASANFMNARVIVIGDLGSAHAWELTHRGSSHQVISYFLPSGCA